MICLSAFPLCATDRAADTQKEYEKLLRELPGYWHGEAVETPVGPMNYDIMFHDCPDGAISGVAKTGASLHYWRFITHQDVRHLQFLSTFMGNRTPILLVRRDSEKESLFFYAPARSILSLDIKHTKSNIDIQVFHHDKPHVRILLNKAEDNPATPDQHHRLVNSCNLPLSDN